MVKYLLRGGTALAGVCAMASVMLVNGCAGKVSSAKPLPESKDSVAASPSATDARDTEALAAYRGMWDDLVAVSAAPDPASPRLDDHASGAALALMKHGLTKSREEKVVTKGAVRLLPTVESATKDKVMLWDCVDGTDWLQYKLDGKLKDDVPGSHFKTDATVQRTGGVWKVSDFYVHEAGTC